MLNSIRGSRKVRQNRNKVGRSEQMQSLRNIPRLLRLIWATHPRYALANILLRLLQAALPFTMLYMGKLIVDEVVLQLSLPAGERTLTQIWIWISVEIAMALASDVLNRLSALVDSLLGDLFANASSVRMLEHAARLDLEFFEDPEFYNILERARGTSFGHTQLMSQVLGQIQSIITMLLFAGGLVVFNPWLILLVVVAVVPAFLGDNYFNERNYSMLYNYAPERRELEYLRHVGTNNEAAKEVKIFGLSRFLIGRFAFLSDKFYQDNKHLSQQMAFWGTVFALVGNLGYYGAYAFIVVGTVQGDITLGELTFLSGSVQQLRTRVSSILSGFSQLVNSALFLQDFFDFFAIEPKIKTTIDEPRPFPEVLTEGFVFEGVGFQYPNTDRWVLRKLSFRLGPGEKLALVGENGAGKTTLVKLLTRLYDPTEGRILLEGHDLREYDPEALRSHIGVIFQDFMRYQMTAGTNIAVGRIEAREDRDRIAWSASQSRADAVIAQLPHGYAQQIGRQFAGGVELSGGQWQKVALGRAYMRDASLLILDEPTAALDARAEYEVFERFSELTQGKAAVLISHRFSTVRMADRILVLEHGKLLEMGSHEELLTQGGKYAELFALQAEGYQ